MNAPLAISRSQNEFGKREAASGAKKCPVLQHQRRPVTGTFGQDKIHVSWPFRRKQGRQ
ncbi:MAG TPA: hypothetical protein VFE62_01780 [Gemmataceae bacterium]|nr:hypothetical protein [Gemmataceae bacterium]